VPETVQDKVLEVTRQCLAPNGVAIVSYNTFPGWHIHLMIREAMLYHTQHGSALAERAKKAREFLSFMVKSTEAIAGRSALAMDTAAYTIALRNEEEVLEKRPDLYLVHEHLERENLPVYFHEFASRAAGHGLQYMAEANFFTMHLSNFPSFAAEEIGKMGLGLIEIEQYMDFLRNRSFRQTLLCHQEIGLDRDLKPERLQGLYVAAPIAPVTKDDFDLRSEASEKFVAPNDVVVSVSSPLAKAILLYLHETWPAWTAFDDVLSRAHYRLDPNWLPVQTAERARHDNFALGDMLLRFYIADIVELHAYPMPYVLDPGERPVASPVARMQAERSQHVVSLRHESVTLEDEVSQHLLQNLDGTRDRDDLLAMLEKMVQDGVLLAEANGAGAKELLEHALDRSIGRLTRAALLVG
jgi:methyltransferase-like protein